MSGVLSRLPKRFVPAALVYTLCLALFSAVIAFVAHERHGPAGARASVFAALLCWAAGIGALGSVALFARTPKQVVGLLGSILFRTGLPLVGLLLLTAMPEIRQADGGMVLMTTYLISLVLDVLLTVGLVFDPAANGPATNRPAGVGSGSGAASSAATPASREVV